MAEKYITTLLLFFMLAESNELSAKRGDYYRFFPNMNNPETLASKCTQEEIKNLSNYFIAYRNKYKQVEKIEHLKGDALVDLFRYTYKRTVLTKIIWLKYQDTISDRCEIDFTETHRHTQCFYKSGALYT
ncbi:MAG: hypothetical protein O9262_05260, partial [Cyclobacteriaceae bacterium]|nr:hypothetical protein [Cyclobacteriaceae bacterium]